MSDGKEVKRFYFVPTGDKDFFGSPTFVCPTKSLNGDYWFVTVEDHDRIVAEKDAEISRLTESLEWETALKKAFAQRQTI